MLRGEIRLVDLDPARDTEANKLRPAVVVSNDRANATAARLGRGVVTVVPVTSNLAHVYPFQVALPAAQTGLRHDSKAQAEQIRSRSPASAQLWVSFRRRSWRSSMTRCDCTSRSEPSQPTRMAARRRRPRADQGEQQ